MGQTFLATPLEAVIRSEGIALVTSGLMQKSGDVTYSKGLLAKGTQIYDDQLQNQVKKLSQEYQQLYPESSTRQLEILVDQHLQCWNMVSTKLTAEVHTRVLDAAKAFEVTQGNTPLSQVMQEFGKISIDGLAKENEKMINKVLERQFIEKSLNKGPEPIKPLELLAGSPYITQVGRIQDKQNQTILNQSLLKQKEREL